MNKEYPLVSIIVPVYNAEKTLKQCIKSIIKQTYENKEIILVNDASTDKSLDIGKFMLKRGGVVVNLTKNKGVDNARIKGLEVASGEYIMFVDADDYLAVDAIEKLYEKARATTADVVEGVTMRVIGKWGAIRKKVYTIGEKVIISSELFDKYYISFFGMNILSVGLCGKLFKKNLFDGIEPSGFKMGEDLFMSMKIFPRINIYAVMDAVVYYYRYGGLTSGKYNPHLYLDLKKQYYYKREMIDKYQYFKAVNSTKIEMCNILYSGLCQMAACGQFTKKEICGFIEHEIQIGFIDEITNDIEYSRPYFSILKNKKVDDLVTFIFTEVNKKRFWRLLKMVIAKIL